jgi:hypothetical protein
MNIITIAVHRLAQITFQAFVAATAKILLSGNPLLKVPHVIGVLAFELIRSLRFLRTTSNISLWRGRGGGHVLADEGEKERKNGERKRSNKTRRGRGVGCALAHEWSMG